MQENFSFYFLTSQASFLVYQQIVLILSYFFKGNYVQYLSLYYQFHLNSEVVKLLINWMLNIQFDFIFCLQIINLYQLYYSLLTFILVSNYFLGLWLITILLLLIIMLYLRNFISILRLGSFLNLFLKYYTFIFYFFYLFSWIWISVYQFIFLKMEIFLIIKFLYILF